MIKKKNIGLIIDTNILVDIIATSDHPTTFDKHFIDWIKKIILRIDTHIGDKTITLFANEDVIKDYNSGLSRSGIKRFKKQIRELFRKKTGSRQLVTSGYKIYFSLRKIPKGQTKSTHKYRLTDKYDEKFLVLLESILEKNKWRDWSIIMASCDNTAYDEIKAAAKRHSKRISFVKSESKLAQTIEC